MPKKPQHGGKRAGSGRKPTNPEGKTILVAATVPEALVKQLKALGKKRGWNRSQAVTEAIRELVAKG